LLLGAVLDFQFLLFGTDRPAEAESGGQPRTIHKCPVCAAGIDQQDLIAFLFELGVKSRGKGSLIQMPFVDDLPMVIFFFSNLTVNGAQSFGRTVKVGISISKIALHFLNSSCSL